MAKARKIKPASGLEIPGSGNAYKDLGFKNADAMLTRARMRVAPWTDESGSGGC